MKRSLLAVALVVCGLAGRLEAEEAVDAHRNAAPDGIVSIQNAAGSIRVIGWSKPEVSVTGQLGHGATGLAFSGARNRTHIEVETEANPNGVVSHLEIHVPAASRLEIEGFGASVSVSEVTGVVTAETVNGSISVAGDAREVQVESVNGSVEVSGTSKRTHAESVNGAVTVRGVRGELEATTVNGALTVVGGEFERAHLETVAGSLTFDGALSSRATVEMETVSGSVSVTLPAGVAADFTVSTFSGSVENAFGAVPSGPSGHRGHGQREVEFSTGGGGASVSITTLSGGVVLRKK